MSVYVMVYNRMNTVAIHIRFVKGMNKLYGGTSVFTQSIHRFHAFSSIEATKFELTIKNDP